MDDRVGLARAELSESSSRAAAGLVKVAAGAVFLLAGLFFLLAALTAFLVRLGLPVDLSCLIVAIVALIGGGLALRAGAQAFQPSKLMPRRSIEQISSLMRRVELDARMASPPEMSPDELEREADRVRSQIGVTVSQLRTKLTPRNIIGEIAERGGLRDLTPRSFVDFAARRCPVSTVLVGLGLGVLAFFALRSSEKSGPGALRETLGVLTQSARNPSRPTRRRNAKTSFAPPRRSCPPAPSISATLSIRG